MRAFIFDLDGTLVDTVYAHVLALQQALGEAGLDVPGWLLQPVRRPLPGACELLTWLHSNGVPFGIATSGRRPDIEPSLAVLNLPDDTVVLDRSDVLRAKPEPDLFLACQQRMGVRKEDVYVVGDAVWDLLAARRAGMLSVGLLSGGYGVDELNQAGAFRVYRDPQELLQYLDELGIPMPG